MIELIMTIDKKKVLGLFLIVCLLAYAVLSFRNDSSRFSFSLTLLKNFVQGRGYVGYVKYNFLVNIDDNLHLKLNLAVPYDQNKKGKNLTNETPRLQHQFLMLMSKPEVKKIIKNRDYSELKNHLLEMINRSRKDPIKNIYYETILLY